MIAPWWSWLLTAVGLTGWWLAGNGRRAGWTVAIAAQALWLAYALATRQYGFLLAASAYATVAARNRRRWTRHPATPPPAPHHPYAVLLSDGHWAVCCDQCQRHLGDATTRAQADQAITDHGRQVVSGP